ncbi:MAG: prepilin-type N-terminal cleavage/methylation domain-containing protein [Marinibacterium sp.]
MHGRLVANNPPAQSGFSLIELLVAIIVLSIVTIGLYRVFDQGLFAIASDRDRLFAGIVARNRAEEMALNLPELADTVSLAGQDWTIEETEIATTDGFVQVAIAVKPMRGGAGARLIAFRAADSP